MLNIKPCGLSIREILSEAPPMYGALMNFFGWLFLRLFRS